MDNIKFRELNAIQRQPNYPTRLDSSLRHIPRIRFLLKNVIECNVSFRQWLEVWLELVFIHDACTRKGQYMLPCSDRWQSYCLWSCQWYFLVRHYILEGIKNSALSYQELELKGWPRKAISLNISQIFSVNAHSDAHEGYWSHFMHFLIFNLLITVMCNAVAIGSRIIKCGFYTLMWGKITDR